MNDGSMTQVMQIAQNGTTVEDNWGFDSPKWGMPSSRDPDMQNRVFLTMKLKDVEETV